MWKESCFQMLDYVLKFPVLSYFLNGLPDHTLDASADAVLRCTHIGPKTLLVEARSLAVSGCLHRVSTSMAFTFQALVALVMMTMFVPSYSVRSDAAQEQAEADGNGCFLWGKCCKPFCDGTHKDVGSIVRNMKIHSCTVQQQHGQKWCFLCFFSLCVFRWCGTLNWPSWKGIDAYLGLPPGTFFCCLAKLAKYCKFREKMIVSSKNRSLEICPCPTLTKCSFDSNHSATFVSTVQLDCNLWLQGVYWLFARIVARSIYCTWWCVHWHKPG